MELQIIVIVVMEVVITCRCCIFPLSDLSYCQESSQWFIQTISRHSEFFLPLTRSLSPHINSFVCLLYLVWSSSFVYVYIQHTCTYTLHRWAVLQVRLHCIFHMTSVFTQNRLHLSLMAWDTPPLYWHWLWHLLPWGSSELLLYNVIYYRFRVLRGVAGFCPFAGPS